jgi:hypothetical protein
VKELTPLIEKVIGQLGVGSMSGFQAAKWRPNVSNPSDEASFSLFAVELARISGEMRNVPEIRQDLVDDFIKKVEAGEYHPPLQGIAHHLFMAGILNDQE